MKAAWLFFILSILGLFGFVFIYGYQLYFISDESFTEIVRDLQLPEVYEVNSSSTVATGLTQIESTKVSVTGEVLSVSRKQTKKSKNIQGITVRTQMGIREYVLSSRTVVLENGEKVPARVLEPSMEVSIETEASSSGKATAAVITIHRVTSAAHPEPTPDLSHAAGL